MSNGENQLEDMYSQTVLADESSQIIHSRIGIGQMFEECKKTLMDLKEIQKKALKNL